MAGVPREGASERKKHRRDKNFPECPYGAVFYRVMKLLYRLLQRFLLLVGLFFVAHAAGLDAFAHVLDCIDRGVEMITAKIAAI